MKENDMAANFEPHKCVILVQSTKLVPANIKPITVLVS